MKISGIGKLKYLIISIAILLAFSIAYTEPKPTQSSVIPITDSRGKGEWQTGKFSDPKYISRWGYGATDQKAINKIISDINTSVSGHGSVKLETTSGFDTWVYFPNTKDLDLDISHCISFRFYLRSQNKNNWQSPVIVVFRDNEGKTAEFKDFRRRIQDTLKNWVRFEVPIVSEPRTLGWERTIEDGFDWKHIQCFEIHSDTWDYGFITWYDSVEFVSTEPVRWWLSSLDKPDLTITYAEQVPSYYRYFLEYPDGYPELNKELQREKQWPDEGEKVIYKVHIRNVGYAVSKMTDLVCTVDNKEVLRKKISGLEPQQETIVDVPWQWKQGPYVFKAKVDTEMLLDEISKRNNLLSFKTDAYTLAAFCEKDMTEKVDTVNNYYGSFSYEDWLRGATVDSMNRLFAKSKYDFAPKGAEISVRISKIYVLEKLHEQVQKEVPEFGTYDGAWMYAAKSVSEYCNLANSFMGALVHELTHQIGIIDNYQYDLSPKNNKINGKGFSQPDGGIMGGGKITPHKNPAYADIDIAGMNLTKGYRRGFYGEYLYNIPDTNIVLLTIQARPLANASVEVYQKNKKTNEISTPSIQTGETDSNGVFTLINHPVKKSFTTITNSRLKPNPFGNIDVVGKSGLLMIRAKVGEKWYYGFLDIGRFVVAYVKGYKQNAIYKIELQSE